MRAPRRRLRGISNFEKVIFYTIPRSGMVFLFTGPRPEVDFRRAMNLNKSPHHPT